MDATEASYLSKIVNMMDFFCKDHLETVPVAFKDAFMALPQKNGRGAQRQTKKTFLKEKLASVDPGNQQTHVLVFANVTEKLICEWLAGFKGKYGATPSFTVYGTAQSAVVDLFKRHRVDFPSAFFAAIKEVKKGAKRVRAQQKVDGVVPMEEGKFPVTCTAHEMLELQSSPFEKQQWPRAFGV